MIVRNRDRKNVRKRDTCKVLKTAVPATLVADFLIKPSVSLKRNPNEFVAYGVGD